MSFWRKINKQMRAARKAKSNKGELSWTGLVIRPDYARRSRAAKLGWSTRRKRDPFANVGKVLLVGSSTHDGHAPSPGAARFVGFLVLLGGAVLTSYVYRLAFPSHEISRPTANQPMLSLVASSPPHAVDPTVLAHSGPEALPEPKGTLEPIASPAHSPEPDSSEALAAPIQEADDSPVPLASDPASVTESPPGRTAGTLVGSFVSINGQSLVIHSQDDVDETFILRGPTRIQGSAPVRITYVVTEQQSPAEAHGRSVISIDQWDAPQAAWVPVYLGGD